MIRERFLNLVNIMIKENELSADFQKNLNRSEFKNTSIFDACLYEILKTKNSKNIYDLIFYNFKGLEQDYLLNTIIKNCLEKGRECNQNDIETLINIMKAEDARSIEVGNKVVTTKLFNECYKAIIKTNDPESLNKLAFENLNGTNFKDLQKNIIKQNDAETIYYLATLESKKVDINLLQKALLNTNKYSWILKFAQDIKGADIELIGKYFIETKNPSYNYAFAKKIKGANIKAHGEVVIESKDPMYNAMFAKLKGADIDAHNKIIKNYNAEHKSNNNFHGFINIVEKSDDIEENK